MTGFADLAWTTWLPLDGMWPSPTVPRLPGLYRIRPVGRTDLDYVGQTGAGEMNLRKRLAMLRGVYWPEMPYRDPHTAAPALWALVQDGGQLEVSVASVGGPKVWRLALESVVIALYRQGTGARQP